MMHGPENINTNTSTVQLHASGMSQDWNSASARRSSLRRRLFLLHRLRFVELSSKLLPSLSVGLQELVQFSVQRVVPLLQVVQTRVYLVQHGVNGGVL